MFTDLLWLSHLYYWGYRNDNKLSERREHDLPITGNKEYDIENAWYNVNRLIREFNGVK